MKRYFLSTVTAMFCAGTLAAAQATTQQPSQLGAETKSQSGSDTKSQSGTSTGSRSMSNQSGSVTLVGCLYNEKDVPGRTPNVAERAGIMEDYILADASHASASSATPGATGTSGTNASGAMASAKKMYKVEHVDDEKLKPLVGKRVEVVGKIDADDMKDQASNAPKADSNVASPDDVELPEFEAVSIRAIEGTCPSTPSR
ncbi:MAG: hypothetical protein AB7Q29_13130 [Vicinamibacterales bacterium]